MAGAEAEAKKKNWPVVIAILDSGGQPTKVFSDAIAQGGANIRLLNLSGASLLEGGIPIVVDGKIVGGIGVSGVTAQQGHRRAEVAPPRRVGPRVRPAAHWLLPRNVL